MKKEKTEKTNAMRLLIRQEYLIRFMNMILKKQYPAKK